MKLLILTQRMDAADPALGFFVGWVEAIAARSEKVYVVCLEEGTHPTFSNVSVHSLGKESGVRLLTYLYRFFRYAYTLRGEYDAVFVHMNEEYVLLGGAMWKLLGKRIYLWRNHYAGSWRTRLAARFCHKVFCTSKYSYTARFKNAFLMPVGVDLTRFQPIPSAARAPKSILFLARIAPSKRPEMLIDALGAVLARGVSFTASFYGSPLPHDEAYYASLQARAESLGLHDRVRFHAGVPNSATPPLYAAHDLFVNCSPSGMFDKTLFEAAAEGCRVIASSGDFRDLAGDAAYAPDTESLAERLIEALDVGEHQLESERNRMQSLAREESLGTLMDRLMIECVV